MTRSAPITWLLVVWLGASACGRYGHPVRPPRGAETATETPAVAPAPGGGEPQEEQEPRP